MTSFVLVKAPKKSVSSLDGFIKPSAASYQWYETAHGYRLLLWSLTNEDTAAYHSDSSVGFVAVTGTFLYGGQEGRKAISLFLRDFDPDNPKNLKPTGHYALCIQKAERLFVLNDRLGVWKLYYHETGDYISAGVLETVLLDDKPAFSKQGVHEYVFTGHPIGRETLFVSTKALLPGEGLSLTYDSIKVIPCADMPVREEPAAEASLEEVAEDQLSVLHDAIKPYTVIDDKVMSSLSGGYDSRLLLAGFLSEGIKPDLFVYGSAIDADVVSAKAVAEKAGLPIRHVDKSKLCIDLPHLDQLLLYFDASPEDGLALSSGDLPDRLMRAKTAPFMANGSGGEIYRHFFLYPEKVLNRDAFLKATYSRIDSTILQPNFEDEAYHQTVMQSFNALMGNDGNRLTRPEVDLVYSNVRLTHEKARDIIVNNRFQKVLYPFMEHDVVVGARTIPYTYRQFGRLEAKMNALINPELASIPGEYGFNFLDGPSFTHSAKRLESYLRPLWFRHFIPTLKGFVRQGFPAAQIVADISCHLKNKNCPVMESYFKVDTLNDPIIASRIVTLELIAERFGVVVR